MKQRFPKWDNLKCVLIVLVVLGHCIETFIDDSWLFKRMWSMIYVFHMPLFAFVSGLFAKNTIADKLKLKKNICFYLKAYFIYKILLMFVRLVFSGEGKFNLFYEKSIPWYMLAMALFLVITYLVRKVRPSYVLFVSVLLACAIGFDNTIGDFLTLTRVINFYPFFIVGYYAKSDMKIFESSRTKRILSVIVLIGFIAVSWVYISKLYNLRPMLTGRNPYSSFCRVENGILYRIAYYVVASIISLAIIYLMPNKISSFTFLGKKSLQIYIWHGVVLNILRQLSWEEKLMNNLPGLAWKIIVVMSSIVIIGISCIPALDKIFCTITDSREKYVDRKGFELEYHINRSNGENETSTSESLNKIKGWN